METGSPTTCGLDRLGNSDVSQHSVCAILSGLGLILLARSSGNDFGRRAIRILAFSVALIGGLTLFQHISGANLGIDTLLFRGRWGQRAAASANRMGPPASTSFLILGVTLLLATSNQRGRQIASALAILPAAIASLSLIGYWFGSDRLYTVVHLTGIAFQTSTVIAALAVGVMAGIPAHGLVALLVRDDAGGMLVRRVLLPIAVAPLLIGRLRLLGQQAGYYDTAFGLSVMLLTTIAMLIVLLTWTAQGISRADRAARQSQSELEAVLRRDIANRKGVENELRQAEERMRSVVDHVVDGIITIDEHCNIESFNPAAEKLFGYLHGEVIGRNVNLLMPEPYHSQHDGYLHSYLTTGRAQIIGIGREVVGRRKDGSEFPMELAVSTFHIASQRFFTGIVRDITERRRLEDQLRQRVEELAVADRRKDDFLAMLAHELRNPLAPIRAGLEVMKLAEGDLHTVRTVQSTMERQLQQLITLVDDLLDVSRITRGKLQLRKRGVSVAEVVQSAVEASQTFIEEAGHKLKVVVPEHPILIEVDQCRLAQVLSNLLNNAARYTPPGGQIWLAAERQGSDVLLTVRDTGIGIPADMQCRVFQMFAQLDHPPEMEHTGLGIGLALVKSLVEMHGGRIEVQSEGPDQGSEFRVRLPISIEASRAELQHPEREPAARENASGLRILVVDDNKGGGEPAQHDD